MKIDENKFLEAEFRKQSELYKTLNASLSETYVKLLAN